MHYLLKCIVSYNKCCITIKVKCRLARKQNAMFNLICEFFDRIFNVIATWFVYITCNKVEPSQPAWISMCQYIPASMNAINMMELQYCPGMMNSAWTIYPFQPDSNQFATSTQDIYYEFENDEFGEDELANWPMALCKDWDYSGATKERRNCKILRNQKGDAGVSKGESHQYNIFYIKYTRVQKSLALMSPTQIAHSIVIAKLSPMVTRIRLAKYMDVDKDIDDMQKTSAKFLEIEYNCGSLSPITIEVPKSHYFAGNEILSKAYVLRYLEHLPVYVRWIFIESEYSLRIIDEDSEVFSLNSRQYVRFEPDGYKIVTEEEEDTNKKDNQTEN